MAGTSDTPSETLREWARDDRVTLAIVFTDIVGSTALGRALGNEQMNGVRRAHFGRSRALLAQHTGREIKTIGDSVMAVFRSIGAALDYAHALYLDPGHTALQARGMRAGIHIGSVDVVGEDIFGTEVDVAARVVGGIEGAEIWLSDQAKRDLERAGARRHRGLQWLSHDRVELKGIGTERLWSLVPGVAPEGAAPPVPEISASNAAARVESPAREGRGMTPDATRPHQIAFGPFRLFPALQLLLEGETPVRLGSRARDLLVALVEQAGQVVTKEALSARLWPNIAVEEGTLRVHVAALRKALQDGQGGRRYIANIAGRGYSFVASVTRENGVSAATAPVGMAEAGNLPALLTRVVGRDGVISGLAEQLIRRRFLTIVGPGGIGKTTVAVAVADRIRASYKDGAWFVELAPLTDPNLVPSVLCALLGITVSGVNPLSELTGWVPDKHILIVLDTCEHVIGAAAALAEALLKAAPHVGILTTSREPLRAEGEWLRRLAPLELPPLQRTSPTAAEALGYSAVELFNARATATTDSFLLDDANVPAVLEICRRLDGVPLALELAAARVDTFGVDGLASRLDDRFGVLTSGRRTALPRQQTLRAAMDWSYELLPEAEQVVLRRLAVFRGAFTTAAAVAMVIDERIAATDAIEGIANLAEKSLITTDIADNNPHHRLLDTTRAYALERLAESGEREAVAHHHAEYYRNLFARAEGEVATRTADEWLADYAREIHNLCAALDWAFSPGGDAAIGVTLTAAAVPLWMGLSLLEECRGRVEQALSALGPGANRDSRCEMQLQAALGASLLFTNGSTSEIEQACTAALRLAESLGDTEYQLRALWGLWVYRNHCGEYSAALAVAQRFYTLAREHADPNDRLSGERMIGVSHHYLGDQTEARRHLEHTLSDYVDPQRRSPFIRLRYDQKVAGQVMLARTVWLQGFADQAWRTVRRAIGDAEALGNPATLCYALCHGGCLVALWVGNLTEAERYTETLLAQSSKHGLALWSAFATRVKGVVIIKGGDVDTGLPLLRAGLDEITDPNPSFPFLTGFCEIVEAFVRGGRIADGLTMVEAGIERFQRGWLTPELLRLKGEILLLQSTPAVAETAADFFWQALDWAHRQGALSWELRAATSLARLWRDQGRSADATGVLQPVYDRFTEGPETADLRSARALLDTLR